MKSITQDHIFLKTQSPYTSKRLVDFIFSTQIEDGQTQTKQPRYTTNAPHGGLLNSLSNNKKARNFRFSLLYPLRGSTALLAVGSRVLESLHPPNLPGREATPGFSPQQTQQKSEKLLFLASVPPQGLELRSSGADTAKKMRRPLGRAINHYHIRATLIM